MSQCAKQCMKMDRRVFLKTAGVGGVMLPNLAGDAGAREDQDEKHAGEKNAVSVRPYQLLCVFCSIGEGKDGDEKIEKLKQVVRDHPDVPLRIVCNAGDVYVYQDPGTREDSPEGRDFNRKRDLDILQRMSWQPGTVLPARTVFRSLHKHITTVAGICGYGTVTSPAWKGCPKAKSGCYEKGRQQGVQAIIPPRTEQEMAKEKERSIQAMLSAKEITIRPHILLCAVCQYGGGTRPPFKADNLPDLLQMILTKKPDVSIKMARQADWMMCGPCPSRVAKLNACVNVLGSGGLSNEKRDLDMLQKLGLNFGSVMPARKLYQLIFERIPTTQDICKREGNQSPCVWWDGCGESNCKKGNANYEKGRKELMEKLQQV
ncbi:MAG: hypothetical protein HZA88_02875 [Verrucomicrobia bacterium]|nr:hypothetical protein [Verrucomicrobiota bacterium]